MIVAPAYGRDYKSAKTAKQAFLSGADFIVKDITSRWCGRYCSYRDFPGEVIEVRYDRLTKLVMVRVPQKEVSL